MMMLPFYNQIRSFFHIDYAVQLHFLSTTVIYFIIVCTKPFSFWQWPGTEKKIETESGLLFCFSSKQAERGYQFEQPTQCQVGVSATQG